MHKVVAMYVGVFALLLATAGVAHSQDAWVMSVEECVAYGLEHNHDYILAQLGADEAAARVREARGALAPSVRIDGTFTQLSPNVPDYELELPPELGIPSIDGVFSVPAIRSRYGFSATLEQPLFSGFGLINQYRGAQYVASSRAESAADAGAAVAYAVRVAYWNLYEATEAQLVVDVALAQAEEQLAVMIRRRDAGAALVSDVLAMQTRVSEVRLQALEAETAVEVARLRLNEVAGLPVDARIVPAAPAALDWDFGIDGDALLPAATSRASFRAAVHDVDAAAAMHRAARSSWLPALYLIGVYDYARPNPYIFPQEDAFTGTWQIGLSARWTLWDSGISAARRTQAALKLDQARERLEQEERRALFRLREGALAVENRRLAASVAEERVREADAAYAAMTSRHELGAALTAELLAAEFALRSARLGHAQALAAYGRAQAALLRELGQTRFGDDTTTTGSGE